MRRPTGTRWLGLWALLTFAIATAGLSAPSVALAKSIEIADLRIVGTFDVRGDLHVDEVRTIDVSGSYSWVEWRLNTQGHELDVTGVAVQDPNDPTKDVALAKTDPGAESQGQYSVSQDGDAVVVHVAIDATDQLYRIRLSYSVVGVATRWSDCSELYWMAVGADTSIPTRHVEVDVVPPASVSAAEVMFWGHGPLNGQTAIGATGIVTLTVDDLPASTFVEVRAIYPAGLLAGLPVGTTPRKDAIVAEEQVLINDANAQRERARIVYWVVIAAAALVSLGILAFVIWAFIRHGREYPSEFPGGYLREDPMPELHPAVVGALWRMGDAADSDVAATLMELADKKIITMSPANVDSPGLGGVFGGHKDTYVLARVAGAKPPHPLDEQLMGILFDDAGDGKTIDLVALKEYAKANAKSYSSSVSEWKKAAGAEVTSLGLLESDSKSFQIATGLLAGVLLVAGFVGFGAIGSWIPLGFTIPVAIVCIVLTLFMRRRSQKGNELYVRYRALRDYLKDFSRLNEAPPASVILWNRFLVLAVVFGIADEVIKQLHDVAPQIVSDPGFQTTYWWVYSTGLGQPSPVSSLQSGFLSASQVATSQMSSSSGGGFSGGGGGGFGGGGFSAG